MKSNENSWNSPKHRWALDNTYVDAGMVPLYLPNTLKLETFIIRPNNKILIKNTNVFNFNCWIININKN